MIFFPDNGLVETRTSLSMELKCCCRIKIDLSFLVPRQFIDLQSSALYSLAN